MKPPLAVNMQRSSNASSQNNNNKGEEDEAYSENDFETYEDD